MTDAAGAALARLGPVLRVLRPSPEATICYDMLSGALIWSDETPSLQTLRSIEGWQVLRFVFHFRTQMILGRPEEADPDPDGVARQIFTESRDAWDEAMRLFPEWPGFDPQRRSADLRQVYESLSAPSRRELEEIERELDAGGAEPAEPR
jgi:hypothetical protein